MAAKFFLLYLPVHIAELGDLIVHAHVAACGWFDITWPIEIFRYGELIHEISFTDYPGIYIINPQFLDVAVEIQQPDGYDGSEISFRIS